jgi:hypothetical protein
MRNTTRFLVPALLLTLLMFTGCPRPPDPGPDPEPIIPVSVILDDMDDGDNKSSILNTDFTGGYWYTFDDLAAPNNGDSKVWPMSETAMTKYGYLTPVATFEMTAPGNSSSAFCARISGYVTTAYQYSFIGMGFDLMDAGTVKTAVDLNALGYTRLKFDYKNGPAVTGNRLWKVKLCSNAHGFTDSCDMPVKTFTATDTWQIFDAALITFAQEGWCNKTTDTCGDNTGTPAGANCHPVNDFIAAVVAFQFQTNLSARPAKADLLVDNVVLVK